MPDSEKTPRQVQHLIKSSVDWVDILLLDWSIARKSFINYFWSPSLSLHKTFFAIMLRVSNSSRNFTGTLCPRLLNYPRQMAISKHSACRENVNSGFQSTTTNRTQAVTSASMEWLRLLDDLWTGNSQIRIISSPGNDNARLHFHHCTHYTHRETNLKAVGFSSKP